MIDTDLPKYIGGALGAALAAGVAAYAALRSVRGDRRKDAVDSASSRAEVHTIETLQRERQQAIEERNASDARAERVIEENVTLRLQLGDLKAELARTESKLRRAYKRLNPDVVADIETNFMPLGKD